MPGEISINKIDTANTFAICHIARIAYIDSARKQPEKFARRLTNFIQKTRNGKLIPGFGGIDKYY